MVSCIEIFGSFGFLALTVEMPVLVVCLVADLEFCEVWVFGFKMVFAMHVTMSVCIVFFCGLGFASDGIGKVNIKQQKKGRLQEVWSYDISSNRFKFVKGSNLRNHPPVYGTTGFYNDSNIFGARERHTSLLINSQEVMI